MTTLFDVANELNPRTRYSNFTSGLAGDSLFYQHCVRDSEKWKTQKGVITWDIFCPFCKQRVEQATTDWSLHTYIGLVGCPECREKHKTSVMSTVRDLELGEVACHI